MPNTSTGGVAPAPARPDPVHELCGFARGIAAGPLLATPLPHPEAGAWRRFEPLHARLRELADAALVEVNQRAGFATAEQIVPPLAAACGELLAWFATNAEDRQRLGFPSGVTPPIQEPAEGAPVDDFRTWQSLLDKAGRKEGRLRQAVRAALTRLELFATATATTAPAPATVETVLPPVQASPVAGPGASNRGTKGKNIDAKMLKMLSDKQDQVLEWSSVEWATAIGCSDSMVRGTETWRVRLKVLKAAQVLDRTERIPRKATRRGRKAG